MSNGVVGDGGAFREGESVGIWNPSWRMRLGDGLGCCGKYEDMTEEEKSEEEGEENEETRRRRKRNRKSIAYGSARPPFSRQSTNTIARNKMRGPSQKRFRELDVRLWAHSHRRAHTPGASPVPSRTSISPMSASSFVTALQINAGKQACSVACYHFWICPDSTPPLPHPASWVLLHMYRVRLRECRTTHGPRSFARTLHMGWGLPPNSFAS